MDTTLSVYGQRQTATLNYEISTVWETKPRTTTQKTSRLLMGPVQELKPCKLCDDDDDDDDEIEQLKFYVNHPEMLNSTSIKTVSVLTQQFVNSINIHKFRVTCFDSC